MTTKTAHPEKILLKQQILDYLKEHQKARVCDIWRDLGFSRQFTHRQLNSLVSEGVVVKSGKPPIVFYQVAALEETRNLPEISNDLRNFINSRYLYVSPLGELVYGFNGFVKWVLSIKEEQALQKLALEYKTTLQEAERHFNKFGFIDATVKIKNTFDNLYLDKVYYLDFYALPKFGKTKYGQLVLYSKQSQSYELIKTLSLQIKPKVEELLTLENIDAVSFIPPTIPRNIQFTKELEKLFNLNLPKVALTKAYVGDIPVAQKTLSKLEERVENASRTIFVKGTGKYKNILLVDDAIGSGSSLNETAKKLKEEGIAEHVIGFAIVGSYKGFDVIREI